MVRVVSRQLESVLVEQNHCQGLRTVAASYYLINIRLDKYTWQDQGS